MDDVISEDGKYSWIFQMSWMLLPVSTVVFQFFLATGKRVVGLAAVQPWHRTPDPVQQLLNWNMDHKYNVYTFMNIKYSKQ